MTAFYVEARNNFTDKKVFDDTINISDLECYNDGTGVTCNVPWTLNTVVESYQQYNLLGICSSIELHFFFHFTYFTFQ